MQNTYLACYQTIIYSRGTLQTEVNFGPQKGFVNVVAVETSIFTVRHLLNIFMEHDLYLMFQ